jgi:hypothetical protein
MAEVDQPRPRGHAGVPVDDPDRRIAIEDEVVGAEVAVADHLLVAGQRAAGGGVMEAPDEPSRAVQPGVRQPHRGADDHLAGEVGEHLTALGVDAEEPRGTVEADRFQVPQEGMDVVRPLMQGPAHGLADPDDALGLPAAGKGLLGHLVHELSLGSTGEAARTARADQGDHGKGGQRP